MAVQIQLRRDTAANWTSADPTLAAGEFAIETDTDKYKIGDGSTAWTSLGYSSLPAGVLQLSGGAMTGAITTNSTFDGRDVAADGATADAALPKAGGAMTGAITTNSTFDGVDIATRDAILTSTTTTANAALPTATAASTYAPLASPTFTGTATAGGINAPIHSVNTQTGTSYTLVLGDANGLVDTDNGSANTVTVPPNSSVAFPVGTQVLVVQQGGGQTTIVAGSGVSLRAKGGLKLAGGSYAGATLIKRSTNDWYVIGSLEA